MGQAMRKTNKKSLIFHGTNIVVAASQPSPHSHRSNEGSERFTNSGLPTSLNLQGKVPPTLDIKKDPRGTVKAGLDWGGIHWRGRKWKNRQEKLWCLKSAAGRNLGTCLKNPDPHNDTPNFGPNKTDGFS